MTIRSNMSCIMVIIGPECPELFVLDFGKIAEFDLVYTLASTTSVRPSDIHPSFHNFLVNTPASTNINQSAPNLVKMYMTIRSRMSLIIELIGSELSELSALELENWPYLTLFTL